MWARFYHDQRVERENAAVTAQFRRELAAAVNNPNAGITPGWAQMTPAQRAAWLERVANTPMSTYVRCDPLQLDQYTTQWNCMGDDGPQPGYLVHDQPGPGGSWVETSP
jgi:hypothetical protein